MSTDDKFILLAEASFSKLYINRNYNCKVIFTSFTQGKPDISYLLPLSYYCEHGFLHLSGNVIRDLVPKAIAKLTDTLTLEQKQDTINNYKQKLQ